MRTEAVFALACIALAAVGSEASGQTFVQLTDLGSGIGPRLTRAVAQARLSRSLFGRIGTKVSFIDQTVVYQFASDPDWSRVLVGLKDQYIHEYRNDGGPGGRLTSPYGVDVSGRKRVYIADRANGRVLVATFDPSTRNLVNPQNWTGPFRRPIDVAWDGQTGPLVWDYVYVLDDSLGTVTYWDLNSGPPGTLLWSYGSPGSTAGQFLWPSGVCVGKTAASNGGTQFTTYFYVVDRGNHRVVWLNRGAGPAWVSSVALSGWDPTDCAVDHFGNLYVVDQTNHHVYKFTYSLYLLATYGTYGKGAYNHNTFAWPHAISVPCGLKTVNGQTVWYCEGRVITAEQWSDSSGAVEHYLGLDAAVTGGPVTDNYGGAWFSYTVTDHASHYVEVLDWNGFHVRTLTWTGLTPPGSQAPYWDGLWDNGSQAPDGYYSFRVHAVSAYGCGGYSWCDKTLTTATFYLGCAGGRFGCYLVRAPDSLPSADEPTTLFIRQRILTEPRPLARLTGPAAQASAAPTATRTGGLAELVRQFGVRGLSFGVTRDAAQAPVGIRIYSLAGRLVRVLVNEQMQPGVYEIGWDGVDERGRPAGPGVYIAVMTARSYRATQRLILRQP